MVFLNGYDEQVYALGKGPSATSIQIQNNVIPYGNTVLIEGKVIDTAPGTKQQEQAARFPNGVPAVSDPSQPDYMAYVYQQQPMPTNTIGVPVSIDVIDSNGNYRNIGTTTTDTSGMYNLPWTPDITGTYTVIASFAGSESYYKSSAQAAFYVSEAPATPTPTQPPALSAADMYFIPAIVGLFVFVAIMSIVIIVIVLKKRP
jgi:hypothetical protein